MQMVARLNVINASTKNASEAIVISTLALYPALGCHTGDWNYQSHFSQSFEIDPASTLLTGRKSYSTHSVCSRCSLAYFYCDTGTVHCKNKPKDNL